MSAPERMMAIRRLFLAKLEEQPSDMEHELRVEMARKELDKALGPIWRHEVEEAGVELDPTGDMGHDCGDMKDRLDKLPMATRKAGFQGLDVPEPEKPKKKHDRVHSVIEALIKFVGK